MTVRSWVLVAWLLLVVQASACTGGKSEPPRAGDASPRAHQPIPSPTAPAEPAKPKPPEVASPPKPAEPPPSRSAEQPQPRPPAAPAPKPTAPAPPRPAAPPAQKPATPPVPQTAAIVDLTALEKRLRDTSAIGVFTNLSLKNQVDDLLGRFRTFHEGQSVGTSNALSPSHPAPRSPTRHHDRAPSGRRQEGLARLGRKTPSTTPALVAGRRAWPEAERRPETDAGERPARAPHESAACESAGAESAASASRATPADPAEVVAPSVRGCANSNTSCPCALSVKRSSASG
jgi:hypothetical protein